MIKKITHKDIQPLKDAARKELLCFPNRVHVEYLGYFINDQLVGFVGTIFYKNKAVLKNDFVLPLYRNRNIYRKLNEERFKEIKRRKITTIEATCTSKSIGLHLKQGAEIIRVYSQLKKVRYSDINRAVKK